MIWIDMTIDNIVILYPCECTSRNIMFFHICSPYQLFLIWCLLFHLSITFHFALHDRLGQRRFHFILFNHVSDHHASLRPAMSTWVFLTRRLRFLFPKWLAVACKTSQAVLLSCEFRADVEGMTASVINQWPPLEHAPPGGIVPIILVLQGTSFSFTDSKHSYCLFFIICILVISVLIYFVSWIWYYFSCVFFKVKN